VNTPTHEEIDSTSSKLDPFQHHQPSHRPVRTARRPAGTFLSLGLTAWILFLPLLALSEPYRVKKGDSLSTIAHHYGVTVWALKAANANKIHNVNHIQVGQTLTIPEGYVRIASAQTPLLQQPRRSTSVSAGDPARVQALRKGLDEGWVVTRNPSTPNKIFVHRSMSGGTLTDLQYLIEESADGSTWTVYRPRWTVSGGSEYGQRVGVISKPTNISIGNCNCL
jgi:LysM repeat protein